MLWGTRIGLYEAFGRAFKAKCENDKFKAKCMNMEGFELSLLLPLGIKDANIDASAGKLVQAIEKCNSVLFLAVMLKSAEDPVAI